MGVIDQRVFQASRFAVMLSLWACSWTLDMRQGATTFFRLQGSQLHAKRRPDLKALRSVCRCFT
jgi:hypothetical protein